jgi:hypothetical protein
MAGFDTGRRFPPPPPVYAPYQCAEVPYDGLSFAGFPERAGWEIIDRPIDVNDPMREAVLLRRIGSGGRSSGSHETSGAPVHLEDRSVDEKGAVLQAWLFFGALTEVFDTAGIALTLTDFLAERDGSTVVSTARLHEYGQRWMAREAELGEEGRAARVRKVFDVIRMSENFLSLWAPEGLFDMATESNYKTSCDRNEQVSDEEAVPQIW